MYTCNDAAPREKADGTATAVRPGATERPPRMRHMRYAVALGIPMIVTADSGDRDRAVPGPWI